MNKDAKIYVAGHTGLAGSALKRSLEQQGYSNIITRDHQSMDLINQQQTEDFFLKEKPEYVFLAAAKVGGIMANNTYRADFIYNNVQIQNNVIHFSWKYGVKKLLFLGSSCIYPKNAPQPLKEEYLLTSELEYTNEPYAIAKIAGLKMCESYNLQYGTNFIPVMPANLYGPGDNYDLDTAHVLPALIRKFHLGRCLELEDWNGLTKDQTKRPIARLSNRNSKEELIQLLYNYGILRNSDGVKIIFWGTGNPRREFLYSDDLASACLALLENPDLEKKSELFRNQEKILHEIRNTQINIGTSTDITIKNLAALIKEIVGFEGSIVWDTKKPDGTHRKLLDSRKINSLGWSATVSLEDGLRRTYQHYRTNL